ncbi:hypothetical protein D3C75_1251840 [compost metagenome]
MVGYLLNHQIQRIGRVEGMAQLLGNQLHLGVDIAEQLLFLFLGQTHIQLHR